MVGLIYGEPYWTLLQTFSIYAQLQIYQQKLYIEYSHCCFFLPNSNYICYVLQKRILCSHTVRSTLHTVWYDAPGAGFANIDPRPLSDSDNAILGALVIEGKIFREALTDIGRQAKSLQENFNESNRQLIEQPIRGTGSHGDNLLLLNVGFCLDYGVCLVYSLYYLISWYFVDTVTIN